MDLENKTVWWCDECGDRFCRTVSDGQKVMLEWYRCRCGIRKLYELKERLVSEGLRINVLGARHNGPREPIPQFQVLAA